MLQNIDIKGYFHLPEDPKEQLAGILKFNQKEGIEVDLFGFFKSFENPSSKETKIVLGITSNGKKVTLVNCYQRSGNMSFPGFPQSKIAAIYLFMGQHYNTIDDIAFDSCSIEYEGLNKWLNVSGFEKPNYDNKAKEFIIKYNTPEKITFNFLENWNAEIVFDFYAPSEFFIPSETVELEQRPVIKLVPKVRESLKKYQTNIQMFSSFLSINYFSYPLIKSLVFYESIEKEEELNTGYNEIELFYQTGIDIDNYENHVNKSNYLIQFQNYGSKFQEFAQEWFKLIGIIA